MMLELINTPVPMILLLACEVKIIFSGKETKTKQYLNSISIISQGDISS